MPIQIEVQKEEEERQRIIYQNPEPYFFLTKRALPVRIYFYLPYDIYSILLTIVVDAQICLPHYVVSSSGP